MSELRADLGNELAAEVSTALGGTIVRAEHQPWGSKNSTWVVTLDDDRRLVLQVFADRNAAIRRIDASRQLEAVGVVPVARTLADGIHRAEPWAVTELIAGRSGYEAAGPNLDDSRWPDMAAAMGRLVPLLRSVDVAEVRLPDVWTSADELVARATDWMVTLGPHLSSGSLRRLAARVIDSAPLALADPPVLCHGDFGPQNVLFVGTEVTGLLDLEDMRIGPPLLDVAWWTWLVRAHTPAAYERSWLAFARAAEIDESASGFQETLHTLTLLRLLETADHFRLTQPEKYPSWATRIETELDRFA